jgi:hypothetical protein
MIEFFLLTAVSASPLPTVAPFPCDGISLIETASVERPVPFASLRQQGTKLAMVRNAAGQRVEQQVSVTNVKPLNGFARCRYVYTSQIDLACYVGSTIPDTETDAISQRLTKTADNVSQCLRNTALLRAESEAGSTPSVTFGGGSRQPFWQITMVPSEEDLSRFQAEVLILGPAPVAQAQRPPRAAPKAKRKSR